MSLLVVGSVAFDAVETPFGKCEKMLGGSASHFSISASYYTDVRIVGVVGGDFSAADQEVFDQHGIDTSDLERIPDGKTFRWRSLRLRSERRPHPRHPTQRLRRFQAKAFRGVEEIAAWFFSETFSQICSAKCGSRSRMLSWWRSIR